MHLAPLLFACLVIVPAALLATLVWFAMTSIEEDLRSFDAHDDMLIAT